MPPTCMKTKTKRLLRTGDERAVTKSVPRFAPVRSLLELLTRSAPAVATVWLSNRRNALTAREARGRCGRRGDARPPHDDAARNQPPRQPGKAALVPVRLPNFRFGESFFAKPSPAAGHCL